MLEKSPAGAHQWTPLSQEDVDMAPDAEDSNMKVPTMMTIVDSVAMIRDPEYRKIAKHLHENPDAFADAFSHEHGSSFFTETWGQKFVVWGPDVPEEDFIW